MNDMLLLENYLLVLKSTVEVYVHGTLESSNECVRKVLKHGLDETLSNQANTYNLMTDYNFYEVSNVKEEDIKKIYSKISKESN